jgi:hypothetical protein
LDLEIPKKGITNREWMKKGRNPYVKGKDGKVVPTEQHHSQQKGSGPIFEIKQTTHKNPTNQQILHPYNKQGVSYNKSTSSFSLESVDIKAT